MSSPETELVVDVDLFRRALESLQEALAARQAEPLNTFIRDSVVKRYEFTYELAVRSLARYLQSSAFSSTEVEDLTFQGIIRRGDKAELLRSGWPEWKRFREARNQTAHTYSEGKAVAVVETSESFVAEAAHLLSRLTERMKSNG